MPDAPFGGEAVKPVDIDLPGFVAAGQWINGVFIISETDKLDAVPRTEYAGQSCSNLRVFSRFPVQ
jgi:hypothetical protein